jgi:phosphinothricin acetyltransferase
MFSIRGMSTEDWPQVSGIYRQGLATGCSTFEAEVPAFEQWDMAHIQKCRLVALTNGVVSGWAALSPVSGRRVYGGVAEVSVYVGEKYRGQKIGKSLLEAIIAESENEGYWTIQASIFEENTASAALHLKCGFRTVGVRERIGRDSSGKWRNTLLLERRSNKTGMD